MLSNFFAHTVLISFAGLEEQQRSSAHLSRYASNTGIKHSALSVLEYARALWLMANQKP